MFFLFLQLIKHNLATIGTVVGDSDNFLIFWPALLFHVMSVEGKEETMYKKNMPCRHINHYYSFRATFFHGIEKGEMCLDEGEIC